MTSYENRFDQLYKDEWTHDNEVDIQDLLLDDYPYSVEVVLPHGGRWLELGIGSGRVVDYHRKKMNSSDQIIGLDYNLSSLNTGECPQYSIQTEVF